jgi:hypothetical protein
MNKKPKHIDDFEIVTAENVDEYLAAVDRWMEEDLEDETPDLVLTPWALEKQGPDKVIDCIEEGVSDHCGFDMFVNALESKGLFLGEILDDVLGEKLPEELREIYMDLMGRAWVFFFDYESLLLGPSNQAIKRRYREYLRLVSSSQEPIQERAEALASSFCAQPALLCALASRKCHTFELGIEEWTPSEAEAQRLFCLLMAFINQVSEETIAAHATIQHTNDNQ